MHFGVAPETSETRQILDSTHWESQQSATKPTEFSQQAIDFCTTKSKRKPSGYVPVFYIDQTTTPCAASQYQMAALAYQEEFLSDRKA